MSGGQRIDDHKFWGGSGSKDSVFPEGVHTKHYESVEGAGEMNKYEDTNETIQATQREGISKTKAKPVKAGYRN